MKINGVFDMLKGSSFKKSVNHQRKREIPHPWIKVSINSGDTDISMFMRDDGSIDGDLVFQAVKEELLMRHRSELRSQKRLASV